MCCNVDKFFFSTVHVLIRLAPEVATTGMYYELKLYPFTAPEMRLVGINSVNTRSIFISKISYAFVP